MALMDELVARVGEKANLPEKKARQAVVTMLEFLDVRLPLPFTGRLRYLVQGGRRRRSAGPTAPEIVEAAGIEPGRMFGSGT